MISVAILVSGALAYRYAIIMQSMHQLGVPGSSPSEAGPCHLALHPGYLTCGHFPPDPRAPRTEFVQLSIRLWPNALIGYHNWTLPDSAAWLATTDSIRQTFAREGGKALDCRTDSSEEHPGGFTY